MELPGLGSILRESGGRSSVSPILAGMFGWVVGFLGVFIELRHRLLVGALLSQSMLLVVFCNKTRGNVCFGRLGYRKKP